MGMTGGRHSKLQYISEYIWVLLVLLEIEIGEVVFLQIFYKSASSFFFFFKSFSLLLNEFSLKNCEQLTPISS